MPTNPNEPRLDQPDVPPILVDGPAVTTPAEPPPADGQAQYQPPPSPDAATQATARHRPGECAQNVPDVEPAAVDPATVAADSPPPARELERAVTDRLVTWTGFVTLFLVCLFGFLVCSQVAATLALAATLPAWLEYALLLPLAAFCLGIIVFTAGILRAWFRLRVVHQVDLATLEDLRRRAQSQENSLAHLQMARQELTRYLQAYPLDGPAAEPMRQAGLTPAEQKVLAEQRQYLLQLNTDSHTWLKSFEKHFQAALDGAARHRIRSWSVRAAGCVMASPLPLLDAALIVGITMKMIRDLCAIYNVRSNRSATLVILNRAIIAAFIAGVGEEAAGWATAAAGEELTEMFGESTLAGIGSGLARTIAPKLGEGALNAFFVHRLGRTTIRLLQPMKPTK